MNHRHLFPNELDLLLDGEVGFGVAPLRAHVDECGHCRARLADARVVVDALEDLPHFAPSPRFVNKVMAEVHVIEPWYAGPVDVARRLLPRSAPVRMLTAATALVVATTTTAAAVWLSLRADAVLFALDLAGGRARSILVDVTSAVLATGLGQPAVDALRAGSLGALAAGVALFFAIAGGAALGFRALARTSRRARE